MSQDAEGKIDRLVVRKISGAHGENGVVVRKKGAIREKKGVEQMRR